jgi:murein DD-endopeptidase MepM/ murein hydrolase activator NlpD
VVFSAINTEQKQLQAFWWQKDAGGDGYYTPNGLALNQYSWKTPILYSRKTSNFGMRPDPFTGNWANHQGIDIGAPIGTEVHVTQGGKIKFFGNQGNYGNVVIVEHANGYETVYGHLSHFANLTKQEMIPQGAVIGFVGSTGRSTGPHLHYELRQYGQAINPERDLTNLADISQSSSLNGEELKRFVKYQNSLFTSKLASR